MAHFKTSRDAEEQERAAYNRISKDLEAMERSPPSHCSAGEMNDQKENQSLVSNCLFDWEATIHGPSDSPYAGGVFKLAMHFPQNYPHSPPEFKTKVYHPNIDSNNGSIGLDILRDKWTAAMTAEKVLLSICSLLTNLNAEDPQERAVGDMYRNDPRGYETKAKKWTEKYAMQTDRSS
ncbi:hypothetical protein HU200_046729 [Digitaria exilis]|uniref:UBC core domain-containing protein n=1 Tax=Digitaria exilis TaxID=1010633 RepID=A0A835AY69_9POAL|nr:hypothetical protein HU200_046729 [Digitaria exilis]